MQPIYVVLIINLMIWTGIFSYLLMTDKKIETLQKKLSKISEEKNG